MPDMNAKNKTRKFDDDTLLTKYFFQLSIFIHTLIFVEKKVKMHT